MIRLRQVALVAADLEPVVGDLCTVLGLEVGFRDPGVAEFGLHNAVMPVGDTFLEVVSPVREGTTAGRYLERRGGDGGYMVIVQVDDLDRRRERLPELGVRVVWTADHPRMRGTHLHPKDTGGAIVSMDWADPPEEWEWAGPSWRDHVRTDVTRAITGVEVQADDPHKLAMRWSEIFEVPVSAGRVLELDGGGRIRVVEAADGRGEGVGGLDVDVADREAVTRAAAERGLRVDGDVVHVAGVRVRLEG